MTLTFTLLLNSNPPLDLVNLDSNHCDYPCAFSHQQPSKHLVDFLIDLDRLHYDPANWTKINNFTN